MTVEEPTPCAAMPTLFDAAEVARTPTQIATLRKLCHSCPMQAPCYLLAVTTPVQQVSGFLAGLTEAQRVRAYRSAA